MNGAHHSPVSSAGPTSNQAPHPFDRLLAGRHPVVMGILNVTPDSFSDGGRYDAPALAITHARRMIEEGADIIDVGGESSRPYGGATPVSAEDELARILPVLPAVVDLARDRGVMVSIDTMKASVAARALGIGVSIVNDVWGLQRDPDMARMVADHGAPVIVMHNRERADPAIDIMVDIEGYFARSLDIAGRAGIARNRIVLDPGIGFGKTPEQSLIVIARFDRFAAFGLPLLIGLSRKRFIASITPSEPQQRLAGSIAGNLLAVLAGAAIVRVHDVAETVQALRVAAAIRNAR
jgi:dihydropteroate synthase